MLEPQAGVALIDLDGAGPAVAGSRPRAGRTSRVLLVMALVVVAVAAAAGPRPVLREVLAVQAGAAAWALTGDALFVGAAEAGGQLRRIGPDGVVAWARPQASAARTLLPRPAAGVLLAVHADATTTAVEHVTGRPLWAADGVVTEVTDTVALLVRYAPDRRTAVLTAYTLRGGTAVWSAPVGVDATWRALGPPRRVVIIAADGAAVSRALDTGAVLGTADLGVRMRRWDGNFREDYRDDFAELTGAGDSLYVVAGDDGTTSLTAYDGSSLALRWRTAGVPAGRVDECGAVLCLADLSVLGADPGAVGADRDVVAYDPGTGARRWSARGFETVTALSGDRLIGTFRRTSRLLDARTGAGLAELAAGQSLPGADPGTRLVVHRDTVDRRRTWVRMLDVRTGRTVVAGTIPPVAPGCAAAGDRLACPVLDGPLTVWRLPARGR